MKKIKKLFHDLPIARKFYFAFGFIFFILILSSIYFYYILYQTNQYANIEERISKINFSVDTLIVVSLENMVFLNDYNDMYDYSLINKMRKNRIKMINEIDKLKQITKIGEVHSKLLLYESLLDKKEILREQIIDLVNLHENETKISLIRHQRELLDNESISYLKRIKEIEKENLENTRDLHNQARRKLKIAFLLMVIFLFLSIFLISYYISRIIISDIKLISDSVNDISRGNYSSRIKQINKDELGTLSTFLNTMSERLQTAKEVMLKITQDLKLKLSEEQKAETLLEEQASELERIAYYDNITGLPNKILFEKHFLTILDKYSTDTQIALVFLNIRNFKNINETLGHEYGDQLLKEVATRLIESKNHDDIVCRFAGDEFIMLCVGIENRIFLDKKTDFLLSLFDKPFHLKNYTITVSINLGVAIYPEAGKTVVELLKNADSALYKAKELDQEKMIFAKPLEDEKKELVQIELTLRNAITEKQFYLAYQPIVNGNKLVCGVEVLLRWNPSVFPSHLTNEEIIPFAEKIGLIIPLGNAVVENALKQYARWKEKNFNIKMSINLSTKQVIQKDFIIWIKNLFLTLKINPADISFELTETAIVRDMVVTKNNLIQLRDLGCGVLIDDFGSGYASINLIKSLPITGIKIDKSYIQKELHDRKNLAVLKMMIAFAESMDFEVIAEGIETEEQFQFIRSLAPTQKIQGLYTSKALSADEIEKWFRCN